MDAPKKDSEIFEAKVDELDSVLCGWYQENLHDGDRDDLAYQEYEKLLDEVAGMNCACSKCSINLVDRFLWKQQKIKNLNGSDFEKTKFSIQTFIYAISHLAALSHVCNRCGLNHKLDDLIEGYFFMGVLMGSNREREDFGLQNIVKKANDARHLFNRQRADEIKRWYLDNRKKFKNKDVAAQEGEGIFHISFSTMRKHLRGL